MCTAKSTRKLLNPLQCSKAQGQSIRFNCTVHRGSTGQAVLSSMSQANSSSEKSKQFKSQWNYTFLLVLSVCWVRNLGKHLFPPWTPLEQSGCHHVMYCTWKPFSAALGTVVFKVTSTHSLQWKLKGNRWVFPLLSIFHSKCYFAQMNAFSILERPHLHTLLTH